PSPWGRTVLVNRGRVDGVAPGMTVVAGKVLVGRVIEAGPAVCRVRLVTDPASKIAVTIGKPGTVAVEGEPTPVDRVAVCKGSGRADPGLTVEWLERDVAAGVREGDLVYTSGGEGVFPKGLVVGRVTRLRLEAGAAFAEVTAAPAVDPRRLCRVSLIAAAPAAAGLVADPAAGFIAGDAGDIARAAPYARAPVAR
ncbi:MAG: rod shape-determining protein MreC, partial [Planctomycetes bacterium]|nr:rod shape-determining protein MreC [Planctomycetota bacterium]